MLSIGRKMRVNRTGMWATVAFSILVFAACSSGALAQSTPDPLPERLQVDVNGVDLATGRFHLSATDVAIGPAGGGGLSYTRHYSGTGWRSDAYGSIHKNGSTYTVSLGATSEVFTGAGGVFTPENESGSNIGPERRELYLHAGGWRGCGL